LINSALYRDPQLLDSKLHRRKRLKRLEDFSITRNMHAVFVAAAEFPSAGIDLPIIFVNTGERTALGQPMVAPVALLGLVANENLHLDGTRWDARYLPAFIRRFPFLTAGVPGSSTPGVFIDMAWSGVNDTEGEALFDADGKPTEMLANSISFLQRFDEEQQRTRAFCARILELDLLKEMQADATLPNGETLKVDGFLLVDEAKLRDLPDAVVVELHRSGMLGMMHAHLMSLGNVQHLVERKATRVAATLA